MRVATVDIGTNTALLLIAEVRDGTLVAVDEQAAIVRLGEGVDRSRVLAPQALVRTLGCLERYAARTAELGVERVDVVGTSALRDVGGSELLQESVARLFGVPLRIISGDEEALLTFRGSLSGLSFGQGQDGADPKVAVFDIGGGSTEVVVGTAPGSLAQMGAAQSQIGFAQSFDVGSVRLAERYLRGDPPTPEQLDAVAQDARAAFSHLPALVAGTELVGIAGTMTTFAAMHLQMRRYDASKIHGHRLSMDDVRRLVTNLRSQPLREREKIAGLDPKRADVIVPGGILALELLSLLQASSFRVSDRGVRWGLAERLAS